MFWGIFLRDPDIPLDESGASIDKVCKVRPHDEEYVPLKGWSCFIQYMQLKPGKLEMKISMAAGWEKYTLVLNFTRVLQKGYILALIRLWIV